MCDQHTESIDTALSGLQESQKLRQAWLGFRKGYPFLEEEIRSRSSAMPELRKETHTHTYVRNSETVFVKMVAVAQGG